MRYLPLTDDDRKAMLAKIGAPFVDSLYSDVPEKVRLKGPVDLPPFASEMEVERYMTGLAAKISAPDRFPASSAPAPIGTTSRPPSIT